MARRTQHSPTARRILAGCLAHSRRPSSSESRTDTAHPRATGCRPNPRDSNPNSTAPRARKPPAERHSSDRANRRAHRPGPHGPHSHSLPNHRFRSLARAANGIPSTHLHPARNGLKRRFTPPLSPIALYIYNQTINKHSHIEPIPRKTLKTPPHENQNPVFSGKLLHSIPTSH
jgi:hypothetical protein